MPGAAWPWKYTWSPGWPSSFPRKKWLNPTPYKPAPRAVVLAAEEVVEPDLVQAGRRGERGQVAADAVGVLVGVDDHDGGVPADVGTDAALDVLVTGEPRLELGGDGVDVRGGDGGREA